MKKQNTQKVVGLLKSAGFDFNRVKNDKIKQGLTVMQINSKKLGVLCNIYNSGAVNRVLEANGFKTSLENEVVYVNT
jgi:hypothetical protein